MVFKLPPACRKAFGSKNTSSLLTQQAVRWSGDFLPQPSWESACQWCWASSWLLTPTRGRGDHFCRVGKLLSFWTVEDRSLPRHLFIFWLLWAICRQCCGRPGLWLFCGDLPSSSACCIYVHHCFQLHPQWPNGCQEWFSRWWFQVFFWIFTIFHPYLGKWSNLPSAAYF